MNTRRRWLPILVGTFLFGSTLWADGLKVPACMAVVDSRNRPVGTLLDEDFQTGNERIVLDVGRDRVFVVSADTTGIRGGDEGTSFVYFTSPDCSGTPFVPVFFLALTSLIPRTAVASPNITLYAQVPGELEQEITVQSTRSLGNQDCQPFNLTTFGVKSEAITDLSTFVEPPLKLNARACDRHAPQE